MGEMDFGIQVGTHAEYLTLVPWVGVGPMVITQAGRKVEFALKGRLLYNLSDTSTVCTRSTSGAHFKIHPLSMILCMITAVQCTHPT